MKDEGYEGSRMPFQGLLAYPRPAIIYPPRQSLIYSSFISLPSRSHFFSLYLTNFSSCLSLPSLIYSHPLQICSEFISYKPIFWTAIPIRQCNNLKVDLIAGTHPINPSSQ